jgi:16S rRNA G527 N7-methylase RsmG
LKHAGIEKATVLADRFENVSGLNAGFVTCRALDRFTHKLQKLIDWAPPATTLLLYGGNSLREELQQLMIAFEAHLLPDSKQRFLFILQK